MMHQGRPRINSAVKWPKLPTDEELSSDVTLFVDKVMFRYYSALVPLLLDEYNQIAQRLASKCKRVKEIREERKQLADAYNRYVMLHSEHRQLERDIDRLVGIIGSAGLQEAMKEDSSSSIREVFEAFNVSAKELREQLPLWEVVAEYLADGKEARISEIQVFLTVCGIGDVSREAIESALRRHKKQFKISKRKREKFISMKGGI